MLLHTSNKETKKEIKKQLHPPKNKTFSNKLDQGGKRKKQRHKTNSETKRTDLWYSEVGVRRGK